MTETRNTLGMFSSSTNVFPHQSLSDRYQEIYHAELKKQGDLKSFIKKHSGLAIIQELEKMQCSISYFGRLGSVIDPQHKNFHLELSKTAATIRSTSRLHLAFVTFPDNASFLIDLGSLNNTIIRKETAFSADQNNDLKKVTSKINDLINHVINNFSIMQQLSKFLILQDEEFVLCDDIPKIFRCAAEKDYINFKNSLNIKKFPAFHQEIHHLLPYLNNSMTTFIKMISEEYEKNAAQNITILTDNEGLGLYPLLPGNHQVLLGYEGEFSLKMNIPSIQPVCEKRSTFTLA